MFRIERSDDAREVPDWRVVDETRDVELRALRGVGGAEGDSLFRLTSKGREVPFIAKDSRQASGTGFVYEFRHFGRARPSKHFPDPDPIVFDGEPPYRFATPAERSELLLLAVEALLVYGWLYNGLGLPDGACLVAAEIDGENRVFRLSDFGYVEPGNRIRLWVDGEPEEYTLE